MSRTDEQQADLLGVRIAHDARYDPRGLPQFFEIIQAKYGNGSAQFLSDHPSPGNRTGCVNKEIALLPPLLQPVKSSPQFEAIHQVAIERHALTAREIQTGAWRSTGLYATAPGNLSPAAPTAGPRPRPPRFPVKPASAPLLPKPEEPPQPPPSPTLPGPTDAERLPAEAPARRCRQPSRRRAPSARLHRLLPQPGA